MMSTCSGKGHMHSTLSLVSDVSTVLPSGYVTCKVDMVSLTDMCSNLVHDVHMWNTESKTCIDECSHVLDLTVVRNLTVRLHRSWWPSFSYVGADLSLLCWLNVALRPQKPSGLLGMGAQGGHLNFHTAPEFWPALLTLTMLLYVHRSDVAY